MVKNPRKLYLKSPDHGAGVTYEVDIIDAASGQVAQTIQVDTVAVNEAGEVEIDLNVQPVKFGQFTFAARAEAEGQTSETSDPSEAWQRSPGKPAELRPGV